MQKQNFCAVCNVEANQVCGACNLVYYCSRDHQKSHWNIHKQQCKPYTVATDEKLGRYMVAARDLNAGDLILREKPILIGPKQDTRPVCLSCYENLNSDALRCPKCHFPFCSEECAKDEGHEEECRVLSLARNRFIIDSYDNIHPAYECITPLRAVLLKEAEPSCYETFMKLQHHNESRTGSEIWRADQTNTVDYLRKRCGLADQVTELEVHSVCGILQVNSFEIRLAAGHYIRGIYPTAAMMAHSCVSNTFHVIKLNKQEMIVRAAVPIKKGQPIYVSYTHSLEGTKERRRNIRFSKFFDCDCLRCADPSELGTNFSALKCRQCNEDIILPEDPLSDTTRWNCQRCNFSMTWQEVDQLVAKLRSEFESIGHNETEKFELFIKIHSNKLHENHFLLTQARHFLSQLYGRDARFLLNNLPEPLLKRKSLICQQLLAVANDLEPGLSRLRGVTLYELHAPLVLLAKRRFEEEERINREEFRDEVAKAIEILEESSRILALEDENSSEGAMAKAAKVTLQQLQRWVVL